MVTLSERAISSCERHSFQFSVVLAHHPGDQIDIDLGESDGAGEIV